jgi:hypothetical protein
VPRFVQAVVHAPAKVLDKHAEGAALDRRDDGALVELDMSAGQLNVLSYGRRRSRRVVDNGAAR